MNELRREYEKVKAELETAEAEIIKLGDRHKFIEKKIYSLEENIQEIEQEKGATLINLAKNESEENIENFEIAKFKIAIDKLEKEKRESEEFSSTIVSLINELRDQKIPKLKQKVIGERHKLGRVIKDAMIEEIKLLAGDKVKMLWGVYSVIGGASYRDLLLRELFKLPSPEEIRPYHEKAWKMLDVEN